jgi:hypothetical protein
MGFVEYDVLGPSFLSFVQCAGRQQLRNDASHWLLSGGYLFHFPSFHHQTQSQSPFQYHL